MLYEIDNKFYIKVQGYYKGVDVTVNGNDLEITPNGEELEVYNVQEFVIPIDMATGKQEVIDKLEKKDEFKDLRFSEKNHKRSSRI